METRLINSDKGYIWPFDKLCINCNSNIHIEKKEDLLKVTNGATGEIKYFCQCKCGEPYRIPAEQIPEEIRNSL